MASTKASGPTDRIASPARVAIISSGSLARTARISARSAGARCAPPVHIASFRSRVARPCRRSSTTSGLRVSNGSLPRSEEHTSELQSHSDLVCRLLLEKKKARLAGALGFLIQFVAVDLLE